MDPKVLITIENEEYYKGEHVSIPTDTTVHSQQVIKRYFGENIVFGWYKDEPLFNLGPHYQIFLCCLFFFEIFGVIVYIFAATYQKEIIRIVFGLMIILEAITYIYTGLKNPGIVTAKDPDDTQVQKHTKSRRFCPKCRILRDKTTFHCLDCEVCIKGYDHHCPWTGKCIGAGNLYAFYAFLLTTLFYLIFCIGLIILRILEIQL